MGTCKDCLHYGVCYKQQELLDEREMEEEQECCEDASRYIELPCKVGDTAYPLYADSRFRAFIEKIEINANELLFYWVQYDVGAEYTECWDEGAFTIDDIGKTVFLDEVEYLIALKKGKRND